MGKKKKFDKKSGITFHLVHRSQQDPLITDETAPQHVLVPANISRESNAPLTKAEKLDPEKRKKEQQKYGIYFDDEYDYLQHLRGPETMQSMEWRTLDSKKETKHDKSLKLPSSVFASAVEEEEGLLHKQQEVKGFRPDWDPEVVAALDDDFDFDDPDNQLEDNFVTLALEGGEDDDELLSDEYEDDESDFGSYGSEERDTLGKLKTRIKDDNKSCFTEYSVSSSVIRRNQQLTLLDDKFEKFFEQYDDMELGALEGDDIAGELDDTQKDNVLRYAVELKREHKYIPYDKSIDKERIASLLEESDDEEFEELEMPDENEESWDCQSILSTYSNIYNHPKLIEEPKKPKKISIDKKKGIPTDPSSQPKLSSKSLAKLERQQLPKDDSDGEVDKAETIISTLKELSLRPKDESAAERRERKRLIKEYRNDRRVERKMNALAFKQEQQRQTQMKAANGLKTTKIV